MLTPRRGCSPPRTGKRRRRVRSAAADQGCRPGALCSGSSSRMGSSWTATRTSARSDARSSMEQLEPAEKIVLRDLGAVVAVRSSQRVLLMGVSILNAIAAAEFIQLFDVATAGAVTLGTTVPDYEFSVAASSSIVPVLPPGGILFRNGLQIASSTAEKGATPSGAG